MFLIGLLYLLHLFSLFGACSLPCLHDSVGVGRAAHVLCGLALHGEPRNKLFLLVVVVRLMEITKLHRGAGRKRPSHTSFVVQNKCFMGLLRTSQSITHTSVTLPCKRGTGGKVELLTAVGMQACYSVNREGKGRGRQAASGAAMIEDCIEFCISILW